MLGWLRITQMSESWNVTKCELEISISVKIILVKVMFLQNEQKSMIHSFWIFRWNLAVQLSLWPNQQTLHWQCLMRQEVRGMIEFHSTWIYICSVFVWGYSSFSEVFMFSVQVFYLWCYKNIKKIYYIQAYLRTDSRHW